MKFIFLAAVRLAFSEWTSALQALALSASAFVLSKTLKTQGGLRSITASKFEKTKTNVLISKTEKGNSTRTPTEISPSRRRDIKVQ